MSYSYRDLEIWQLGMDLVERIYNITAEFPSDERVWFDLSNETSCGLDSKQHLRRMGAGLSGEPC
jgi:23S rRNA-intervening sequence protein